MRRLLSAAALVFCLLLGGPYAGLSAAPLRGNADLAHIVIHESDVRSEGYRTMSLPGPVGHPIPETHQSWNKQLWKAHGYLGSWGAQFSHTVPGKHLQQNGYFDSDVNAFSSPANAAWAFQRELAAQSHLPAVQAPQVGDQSRTYRCTLKQCGPGIFFTAIVFRRGRYLGVVYGQEFSSRPSFVRSLAVLMDQRARAIHDLLTLSPADAGIADTVSSVASFPCGPGCASLSRRVTEAVLVRNTWVGWLLPENDRT